MQTQREFIEKRLAAHKAGTVSIDRDPLVLAIRASWADSQEVRANWGRRRFESTDHTPERRATSIMGRRQAD